MRTSSSDSADSASIDPAGALRCPSLIHDRVVDLANESTDRSEFLKALATDLQSSFGAAIVAIQASHWARAMMFVVDDLMSQEADRAAIRDLLATATTSAIACDVPMSDSGTARGIRIELTSASERATALLVYPDQDQPSAGTLYEDLKRLSLYAGSTRSVVAQLPIDGETEPSLPEKGLTDPAAFEATPNRDSLRLFHLDLDLNATCYRIANESRRLLRCDRVTLLVPKSGRYRVKAVSGVSVVDSRSNAIRSIQRLTQTAAVMSRPLILPGQESLPPQIQGPLDEYLDESSVMNAVLLPLHSPNLDDCSHGAEATELDPFNDQGDIIGVMVLENFYSSAPMSIGPETVLVAGEATLSLRNSLEHKQVFGLSLWKSIGKLVQSSRMPLVITSLLLAVAVMIGSMIFQVEHYVIATGSVEPTARRELFATVDGTVKELHVHDGQEVKAGELLLELENAELENRAESMAGEIQTASQRLHSIRAIRLSNRVESGQSSRMVVEERQLESELANLRAQQQIIQTQKKELSIWSPIDGTVVGWQLERRLTNRPVARGNLLISVADHQGPWSLHLKVPDRNAGPVLSAAEDNPQLPVHFAVATQPEASFTATLEFISTAARLDELGEHVVDATAKVAIGDSESVAIENLDSFIPADMRIGADVTAKVTCGRRTILRSWFSDVFDFVHRNVLFYF